MANFSAEQKIFITRLYLEGKHSYMDLQKIFEVSYQMIQGWVRLYQIQGADGNPIQVILRSLKWMYLII
ncbi:hypothetical protein C6W19_12960 [Bacillus sp. RJGP41]|nr:hypothetical protein C6W19_12960 [Bacillus sp. RJGP41]